MHSVKIIRSKNENEPLRFGVYDFSRSAKPIAVFDSVTSTNSFLRFVSGELLTVDEAEKLDHALKKAEKRYE